VLDRTHPTPFLEREVADVVGVILLVIGMIGIPALISFRRARTSPVPWRPATALVTDGPYRYTRNPMYVGITALYLGGTVLANTLWPLVVLPAILLVMNLWVIPGEERHLEEQFGDEYREYRLNVRRWI